ncbi:MAG: phage tail tip lysozyme, partial [Janthinobacterium lividum]
REYQDMYKASGIDAQKAAADSHAFMNSLRGVGAAVGILSDKVAADLTKGAGANLDRFREGLVRNFARIEHGMETAGRVALSIATAVVTLASRAAQAFGDLSDWFSHLNDSTKRVIETLALLLAGWRALSAGFLATPLGKVLLLGTALVALYDDFQTWKEGGKSLIDWGVWAPQIEQAVKAFADFGAAIKAPLVEFAQAFKDTVVWAFGWLHEHQPDFGSDSLREFIHLLRVATDLLHGDFAAARKDMAAVVADEFKTETGVTLDDAKNTPQKSGVVGWWQNHAPTWLGGMTPEKLDPSLDVNREKAVTWWQKVAGFTPQGAAAMAAQEEQESGYDPSRRGDGGKAGGSFQWHQDRRDKIFNATGIDVYTDRDQTHQRLAMLAEMKMGLDAQAGHAYERIRDATESGEATKLGVALVERPADTIGEIDHRSAIAARIEHHMAQVAGPVAARPLPPGAPNTPMPAGQMLRTENNSLPAPVLNQTTHVTVNGVSDPKQAAKSVEDAQTRVNGDMVRQFLPAAY